MSHSRVARAEALQLAKASLNVEAALDFLRKAHVGAPEDVTPEVIEVVARVAELVSKREYAAFQKLTVKS